MCAIRGLTVFCLKSFLYFYHVDVSVIFYTFDCMTISYEYKCLLQRWKVGLYMHHSVFFTQLDCSQISATVNKMYISYFTEYERANSKKHYDQWHFKARCLQRQLFSNMMSLCQNRETEVHQFFLVLIPIFQTPGNCRLRLYGYP